MAWKVELNGLDANVLRSLGHVEDVQRTSRGKWYKKSRVELQWWFAVNNGGATAVSKKSSCDCASLVWLGESAFDFFELTVSASGDEESSRWALLEDEVLCSGYLAALRDPSPRLFSSFIVRLSGKVKLDVDPEFRENHTQALAAAARWCPSPSPDNFFRYRSMAAEGAFLNVFRARSSPPS